jgi:hypothetical protein
MKFIVITFVTLISLFSCNKESTPESTLEALVESRFSGSDRDDLLELTTGKLKNQLENMSDDNVKLFLETDGLRRRTLKITLKNCDTDKCFITYILKYEDKRPQGTSFNVEVKKIAEVVLEDKKWLVSDISNLKTYIDSKKEINALED